MNNHFRERNDFRNSYYSRHSLLEHIISNQPTSFFHWDCMQRGLAANRFGALHSHTEISHLFLYTDLIYFMMPDEFFFYGFFSSFILFRQNPQPHFHAEGISLQAHLHQPHSEGVSPQPASSNILLLVATINLSNLHQLSPSSFSVSLLHLLGLGMESYWESSGVRVDIPKS